MSRSSELDLLLDSDPTEEHWVRVCALAERLDGPTLDAVAWRLADWPARTRVMPDRWWRQVCADESRPYHALAACRRFPFIQADLSWRGGCAVATSPGGRWLLVSGGFQPQHAGGALTLWDTRREAAQVLVGGSEYHGVTVAAGFSPDAATVAAVPLVELTEGWFTAWRRSTGERLWRQRIGESLFDAGGGATEAFHRLDSAIECVGLAFSGDGRVVAAAAGLAATVRVLDTVTGELVGEAGDAVGGCGAVAVERAGRRVAYAGTGGTLRVGELGADLRPEHHDTELAEVHALTFAPDGRSLFGAGETADGTPAAQVWRLHGTGITAAPLVRPAGRAARLRPGTVVPDQTRVCWGRQGPLAYVTADNTWKREARNGSVVFDGDGHVRWWQPHRTLGSFSADGRTLVTARCDGPANVTAWFLEHL